MTVRVEQIVGNVAVGGAERHVLDLARGLRARGAEVELICPRPGPLLERLQADAKEYGFGLVGWRDGWFDWQRAPTRSAPPLCAQLRRAVERSQARGRIALVLLDNLGSHTPEHSRLVRALLEELRGQLVLVYTPTYDPEANRIEWLWRALRRAVTHTHTRETLPPLLEDADAWAGTTSATEILRQIGSPFAESYPLNDQDLVHAA